ncbi:hypothetical protein EYM_05060 [Ignicoccus islandicus DSM 13165]|uniref:Uncharacterized protein n=1 Tax=Ignicoccus islandicus DSM 13165 TaxID=940295 RepID=A0A0U3FL44_9CREN|nr:hypothetical protein [Ignicoccus islandicus]ALU12550.1 hypothetical protein EYM_05060 [Ignicoccus islandicus DSM 13165]
MKRIRIRFTKAKWPAKALAQVLSAIAEEYPDNEVLLVKAGQNVPILDINIYVEEEDEEKLKELEKKILSILAENDISHVVYKGVKVFDVESNS